MFKINEERNLLGAVESFNGRSQTVFMLHYLPSFDMISYR